MHRESSRHSMWMMMLGEVGASSSFACILQPRWVELQWRYSASSSTSNAGAGPTPPLDDGVSGFGSAVAPAWFPLDAQTTVSSSDPTPRQRAVPSWPNLHQRLEIQGSSPFRERRAWRFFLAHIHGRYSLMLCVHAAYATHPIASYLPSDPIAHPNLAVHSHQIDTV